MLFEDWADMELVSHVYRLSVDRVASHWQPQLLLQRHHSLLPQIPMQCKELPQTASRKLRNRALPQHQRRGPSAASLT